MTRRTTRARRPGNLRCGVALPSFHIEITKQGWLGTPSDDYDPAVVDLCSHGDIRLVIGGEVIADGDDGDGVGISEAALGLLRTLSSDYRGSHDDPYGDRLIPHGCGTILMMGCGIGIDWSVGHLSDQVCITDVVRYESSGPIRYPGLEVLVASSYYRADVVAFAQHAKEPFEGIEKSFSSPDERVEYSSSGRSNDHLLRVAR